MSNQLWTLTWYYTVRKSPLLFLIQNLYFISLGYSTSELFFANSLHIGVYLCSDYFCSWFADQKGYKLSLEIGMYLQFIYILFAYLAKDYGINYMYASFLIYGLCKAFYGTADILYEYSLVQDNKQFSYPQVKGNIRSILNVVFFILTNIATFLLTKGSDYLILCSILTNILGIACLRSLPSDSPHPSIDEERIIKKIFTFIKEHLKLFISGVLFGSTYFIIDIQTYQLIGKELNLSTESVGIISSIILASGVLARWVVKYTMSLKITNIQLMVSILIIKVILMLLMMTMNPYVIAASFMGHSLLLTVFWAVYDGIFFQKLPPSLKARLNSIRWISSAVLAMMFNQGAAYISSYGANPLILFIIIFSSITFIGTAVLIKDT